MGVLRVRTGRLSAWNAAWCAGVLFLAGLALSSGCSQATSAGAEATGAVTLDGSPLPGVLVSFYPTGGGSSAFATTDEAGKFTVETSGAESGLAPGEYLVTVEAGDSDGEETSSSAIPEKYASEATSGLKVTVSEGTGNELTIELSSAE